MPVRILLIMVLTALLGWDANAEDARQIGWEDLVPKVEPLVDPLAEYSDDVIYDLMYINRVQADIDQGFIDQSSPEFQRANEIRAALAKQGVDVARLLAQTAEMNAKIEQMGREVVPELDGDVVRLPGYVLPLELNDDGVREFLLVPYVGACIHVPPPPANQMVFVKLAEEYPIRSLYAPVWVSGRLVTQSATRSLTYVDGTAPVETGYTLEGILVEPYN